VGKNHSISKLTRLKAERLGEIAKHQDAIRLLEREIQTLDETMRMVDSGVDVDAVRPIRTRTPLFPRGGLMRLVLMLLREAGRPMGRHEIADALEARRGDGLKLHMHVRNCTKRLERGGVLREAGRAPSGEYLYEIAPPEIPSRDDKPQRPKLMLVSKP